MVIKTSGGEGKNFHYSRLVFIYISQPGNSFRFCQTTVSPQWSLPQLGLLFIERVYATLCIASTLRCIWDTVCFHGNLHSQHLHRAYSLSTYFTWFILIHLTLIKSDEVDALYLSFWKWGDKMGFLSGSVVKESSCLQEMWIWLLSLSQEDPLEEDMATYSSILTWKIPWTKEPGGLQSVGLQRVRHNWAHTHTGKWGGDSEVNGNLFGVTDLVSCRGRIYFCLLPSHLLDITQYSNENSQIQMSVHSTGNLIPRMVAVTVMQSIQVISLVRPLNKCWENMPNIRDCTWYPGFEDKLEWIIDFIDLIRRGKEAERHGVKNNQITSKTYFFHIWELNFF